MNNAQNLKPRIGLSSGNGSASQIAGESLSINAEQSGVSVPAVDKKHSSSLTRRATGPRTQVGKQRSKYNATKHAIFSSVALLEGESRSEFNSLLEGLLENFQPIGALEEILVNKLVTLFWRYRRLLIAEAAEIRKGIAFPRTNKDDQSSQRINFVVTYVGRGEEDCELMQRIAAPEIREKCLGLLRDLKTGIEGGGFDINRDSAILTRLYG